jgi:hypothetical protein
MLDFLRLLIHALAAPLPGRKRSWKSRSPCAASAELLREARARKPRLTPADRLLFVWLCRLFRR